MTKAAPFEVAKIYQAIHLTFTTTTYSIHKYGVNIKNMTEESFERRKGKFFYQKIARMYEAEDLPTFFLANSLVRPKAWIGELASEEAKTTYIEYKSRLASLDYAFEQDMAKLAAWCADRSVDLDHLLQGDNPPVIQWHRAGKLIPETIPILNKVFGGKLYDRLARGITDTILWPKTRHFLEQYEPFLEIDVPKYQAIVKKVMNG